MIAELAIKAVNHACLNVKDTKQILLHTALGVQYTSHDFTEYLEKGILYSFSRKGNPYDNACIESFHAILKKEGVNEKEYYQFKTAKRAPLNILNLNTIEREFIVRSII